MMTTAPQRPEERPVESSHADRRPAGGAEIASDAVRDPTAVHAEDPEAESCRNHLDKARRLVALELDLAETRRRLAEQNLEITEAQLELAERELEEVKAENERLRREIAALRGE
jgi:hypothetical protein